MFQILCTLYLEEDLSVFLLPLICSCLQENIDQYLMKLLYSLSYKDFILHSDIVGLILLIN